MSYDTPQDPMTVSTHGTTPAPTPRTDAMQASGKAHYMSLDLARTLERELAAKEAEIARLKEFCREFVFGEENPDAYKTLHDRLAFAQHAMNMLASILKEAGAPDFQNGVEAQRWAESVVACHARASTAEARITELERLLAEAGAFDTIHFNEVGEV